jgi:rhodanese-related sulfurtransferase
MSTIEPGQLNTIRSSNPHAQLIDVRSPAEFQEVHAVGAINIPLDKFNASDVIALQGLNSESPVYLICKMGGRSQKACNALAEAGLTSAVNVTGGTDAWVASGAPVNRGQKQAFSIQRQVQVLAGSFVLAGALLSFLSPLWVLLAAFIGAGLVFSGITNTCGMGTCLAAMPWNQTAKISSANSTSTKPVPAARSGGG